MATAGEADALISGLEVNSVLHILGGGTATMNADTTVTTVTLGNATVLHLNAMQFLHAIGSDLSDTIIAGTANQTLSGGWGTDVLVGFGGYGDTFQDSSAQLNTDTIKNFGGSDTIDLTDMAFGSLLPLQYAPNSGGGVLTITDGMHTSHIRLTGSFTADNFSPADDTHGGTMIGWHA